MSESGRISETSDSLDDEEEEDDYSDEDNEYTGSLEDSGDESVILDKEDEDYSDIDEESPGLVRRRGQLGDGGGAFEKDRGCLLPRRKVAEGPPAYPPDRWPPLLDFLFVFSSFVAAVVAAYFTLF